MPKTPPADELVRFERRGWRCGRCTFGGPRATVRRFKRHFQRAHRDLLPVRLRFEARWSPTLVKS
jgi:hypothetical protein